jgi:Jacalin-like lectin domain
MRCNSLKFAVLAFGTILAGALPHAEAQDLKAIEADLSGGGTAADPLGIFGTGAGVPFRDRAISPAFLIHRVVIRHGCGLDAVKLVAKNPKTGEIKELDHHGGRGGKEEAFELQEGEYIVGVSGRTGTGVDSLIIHTNLDNSKKFGGDGGTDDYRSMAPPGCQVIGFYGRAHGAVTRIGVVYRKIAP